MRLLYAAAPSIVRKTAVLLLIILPVLFQGCPARGEDERILLFDATATVHEDASLTVRERILVKAPGGEIRRGILRAFPPGTFYAAEKHLAGSYFSRLKDYYSGNLGVIFRGLLLFVPMIFITLYIESPLFADVPDSILVPLLILFSTWICLGAAGELWKAGTGKRKFSGPYAIGLALLLILAAGGVCMLWVMFPQDPVITGGYCAAALIVLFFGRIMPAKTEKGARLSEEIEGLAMFPGTAEKHRLAMLDPPEETPRLFEMMLPYAFALDVVETWADRFSSVLENAGYEPEWTGASYRTASGSSGRSAFASGFARSISGTVKTSAASCSPPSSGDPSYRGGSGFSSRSSSGRRGGGGGGRGW